MALPWSQLLRFAPELVSLARQLVDEVHKRRSTTPPPAADPRAEVAALRERLAELDRADQRHAELLARLAEQLELVATSLPAAARRVRVATITAAAALAVGLAALVLALR